jgi:PleD family two-component response regulator
MTILIINQNNTFLNEVKNAFEVQGYEVVATTNKHMAALLFFQYNPSTVILNASLPISKYTHYFKNSKSVFE